MKTKKSENQPLQPEVLPVAESSPMPEKKKMKLWKKIIIGIGIFLFLMIILSMAGTAAPKKALEKELNLIQSGDLKGAYDITAPDFKTTVSYQDYLKFLEKYPALKNFKKFEIDEAETDGDNSTVSGILVDGSKEEAPFEVALIKVKNEWKVLSFNLSPEIQEKEKSKKNVSTQERETSWGKILDEEKMGFSFEYPKDWRLLRPSEYWVAVAGKEGSDAELVEFDASNIPVRQPGGDSASIEDVIASMQSEVKNTIDKKARFSEIIEDSIDREDGLKLDSKAFVITYTKDGIAMTQMRAVVPHGDGLTYHTFAFIAPTDRIEKYSDIGEKIVDSIVINK